MTLKKIIDFEKLSFDVICNKIAQGDNFSFARYGDGEFNAMLGEQGANCDGHPYDLGMGIQLNDTLKKRPEYYCAIHQNAKIQERTIDWLARNGMLNYPFVSNAVFHCATRDGLFDPFWDALKNRKVCIVAPRYVRRQNVIDGPQFVEIPGRDTYKFLGHIKEQLKMVDADDVVFLICASMTAPLIVDWMYERWGDSGTFIDFGSSFDPVVGVKSRSFHAC